MRGAVWCQAASAHLVLRSEITNWLVNWKLEAAIGIEPMNKGFAVLKRLFL
jgi:hypothetical protein